MAKLPCYHGWSSYKTGSSVVYLPNEVEVLNVKKQLPVDRELGCWHLKPSGEIIVLSVDPSGIARSTEFVREKEGLTKTNSPEEFIVQVH
ncbi:hypothetical protein ACJJIU_05660 [Microbulbifer sp. CnH-101-E]|uniref:hypothetical protein n=1 Tax=unclassified Microbulbifer TaxID=2619833 RepID=UPI00403A550B